MHDVKGRSVSTSETVGRKISTMVNTVRDPGVDNRYAMRPIGDTF